MTSVKARLLVVLMLVTVLPQCCGDDCTNDIFGCTPWGEWTGCCSKINTRTRKCLGSLETCRNWCEGNSCKPKASTVEVTQTNSTTPSSKVVQTTKKAETTTASTKGTSHRSAATTQSTASHSSSDGTRGSSEIGNINKVIKTGNYDLLQQALQGAGIVGFNISKLTEYIEKLTAKQDLKGTLTQKDVQDIITCVNNGNCGAEETDPNAEEGTPLTTIAAIFSGIVIFILVMGVIYCYCKDDSPKKAAPKKKATKRLSDAKKEKADKVADSPKNEKKVEDTEGDYTILDWGNLDEKPTTHGSDASSATSGSSRTSGSTGSGSSSTSKHTDETSLDSELSV